MDTKCFLLCRKCLKIVEVMGGCEISSVKTATSLLLKTKTKKIVHSICLLTLSPREAVYLWVSQKHSNRFHIYVKKHVVIANLLNP